MKPLQLINTGSEIEAMDKCCLFNFSISLALLALLFNLGAMGDTDHSELGLLTSIKQEMSYKSNPQAAFSQVGYSLQITLACGMLEKNISYSTVHIVYDPLHSPM